MMCFENTTAVYVFNKLGNQPSGLLLYLYTSGEAHIALLLIGQCKRVQASRVQTEVVALATDELTAGMTCPT